MRDGRRLKVVARLCLLMGLVSLAACETKPLTPESVSGRLEHGHLVADRSKVCSLQESLMAQPGIPVTHAGKVYHQCCPGCAARFMQDPERFSKSRDPISKAVVDKADAFLYEREGRVFFFESLESVVAFDGDPQSHLSVPRPQAGSMPGAQAGGAVGPSGSSSSPPVPPGGELKQMGATEPPPKGASD